MIQQSESINELAGALSKAQSFIKGAVKDTSNPFFKSRYADLASVWEACREPLTTQGLSVVQMPATEFLGTPEVYEFQAKSGETRIGVKVACIVSVRTRLLHSSGQWLEETASCMLATGDPQAVGSAITYLRRYALQSVAGVAPEDDDGEEAMGRPTAPAVKAPVAPQRPVPASRYVVGPVVRRTPTDEEPPMLTDKDIPF